MKLLTLSKVFSRRISTGKVYNAVSWPKPDYGPMEVQRSELMNGIRVAAAKPMGSYMCACTIMFQAGSRYEIDDQIGATHFLRTAASCTGCAYTAYAKNRHLQQFGASLTCSSDRQTISYTLRCPPTCYPELKYYLLDAATRCCFFEWEIDDRRTLIKEDLLRMPPEQRVMDLLQKVMWGGPLSNSMFCVEERVDSMTAHALDCFVRTNFRTDGCSVASVGVPFEETMKLAEKIESRRERPQPRCELVSCARKGFEYYDIGRCSETWIALGVPGCGTCDISNLIKHSIIAAACGVGPISMGQHTLDSAPQPPLGMMVGGDPHTEYRAFNISYNNTGVFGILAKTQANFAHSVAVGAAEFLTNVGELTFKQLDIGKKRLKVNMTINDDNCINSVESLALQLANGVQLDNSGCTLGLIESISNDEICCTARRLSELIGARTAVRRPEEGSRPTALLCPLVSRQFIEEEKARYGIQFYELTSADGYVLNIKICPGTDNSQKMKSIKTENTEDIVMTLLKSYLMKGHHVFMDKYYTDIKRSQKLLSLQTHTNGARKD